MAFDVAVNIKHDCLLTQLSSLLNTSFRSNCNGFYDQFLFDSVIPDSSITIIQQKLKYDRTLNRIENEEGQLMLLYRCNHRDRNHMLHFYQPIYSNFGLIFGLPQIFPTHEEYNYHCLKPDHQSKIIAALQKTNSVEIKSNREYPTDDFFGQYMFSTSEIVSSLSEDQLKTLLYAFEKGYYEIPRKIRTEDLANDLQVSRYKLENNLRVAENHIISVLSSILF